jgi:hypothetical protein
VDRVLVLQHVYAQSLDFTSDFIESIVHGGLREAGGMYTNKT